MALLAPYLAHGLIGALGVLDDVTVTQLSAIVIGRPRGVGRTNASAAGSGRSGSVDVAVVKVRDVWMDVHERRVFVTV